MSLLFKKWIIDDPIANQNRSAIYYASNKAIQCKTVNTATYFNSYVKKWDS